MNLDIIIAFNEVTINMAQSNKLGTNVKTLSGRPLSTIEQMIILSKSLELNWKNIDYKLYAIHSNPVSTQGINRLLTAGYNVMEMKENLLPDRVSNRINAYNDFTDGDFSMVCDCDLIFLREEELNLSKTVCAKLRGQPTNGIFDNDSNEVWRMLYDINEIPVTTETPLHYHAHFNNGCILVNNNKKAEFKKHILSCTEKVLGVMSQLKKYKRSTHFIEEVIVSLAVAKTQDYAVLPEKFNAIVSGCNGKENYSMVHYASYGNLKNFQGYNIQEIINEASNNR